MAQTHENGGKIDAAAHEAAVNAAREEGEAKGRKEGATAERERISAILMCENAAGREAAAIEMALDTETLVAAVSANKMLGRLPHSKLGSKNQFKKFPTLQIDESRIGNFDIQQSYPALAANASTSSSVAS